MPPRVAESEWFADETFWTASYDNMFPEARFAAAPAEVDQILALVPAAHRGGMCWILHAAPDGILPFRLPSVASASPASIAVHSCFNGPENARARAGVAVEWLEVGHTDLSTAGGV